MHLRFLGCLGLLAWVAACSSPEEAREIGEAVGDPVVHVVFDQSLDQISSPFDTSYEGMSRLTAMLRRNGATVSVNNRPLERFLPKIAGPGNVLFLGIPWQRHYSPAALEAIHVFLESGGGVLVVTEHEGIYGHTKIQNELIVPYGIRSLAVAAPGRRHRRAPEGQIWPLAVVPKWGFDTVRVYMPAPLTVEEPARRLVKLRNPDRPDARLIGAYNDSAGGRLVVLADLEIFWNMSPTSGLHAGQNPQFLLRLFAFLGGRETALEPRDPEPHIEGWSEGGKRALFDASGMGWYPDGAPNGLFQLADRLHRAGYRIEVGGGLDYPYSELDLLISVVPLGGFPARERMYEARRMLLVADGRSSLLRTEPDFIKIFKRTMAGARYFYPLDRLTGRMGFRFLGVTLQHDETQSMAAAGRWVEGGAALPLYRSTVIAVSEEADSSVRAVSSKGYWPTTNTVPVLYKWETNPRRKPMLVMVNGRAVRPPLPVVFATPGVFALADLELVTDEVLGTPEGEQVWSEISSWLSAEAPSGPLSESYPAIAPEANRDSD